MPLEFADVVARHDGVDAFNERSRIALSTHELTVRVEILVYHGSELVTMACAADNAPVEFAIHPAHRRNGHGSALLSRLLDDGEREYWAHGDSLAAQALARRHGLVADRSLLRLARGPDAEPRQPATLPANVMIRPFRADDLPALLAVNGRAFASHPDQGAMDRADFERRTASDWFDPAGIFVAESDASVIGFHWTKWDRRRPDAVGEVYVLAVDPDHGGRGTGAALLSRGLRHLAESGAPSTSLYVEADNTAALALYRSFGFVEAARDVLYVSRTPASAGLGPS